MKKLVLLLAMMCLTPALLAENLLINGDWETGDTTGWAARFGGGSVSAVTENPTPRSGMYCGKQINRAETWHGIIQDQNMLDVLVRGETYPYSVWVRTNSATPVNVALTMQSNPGGDARYSNIDNVMADNTDWYQMTGEYTFPLEEDDNGTEFTFYFEVTGSATAELYLDDCVLGTVGPINAPYDPAPEPYMVEGETVGTPYTTDDVNYFVDDVVLNFKAGVNPETEEGIDPLIAKHYVYLSTGMPSDPNLFMIATLPQTSTTDPSQSLVLADVTPDPIVLEAGTTYYWQVKQIMKNAQGQVLADDDPNNVLGEVWEFMTTSPVPTILSISDHMLLDENGDASYTITVSPTGTHFRWFKVVGEVDSVDNGETDDILLTDGGLYSGTTTKTLSITGAALDGSDDGTYYAIAYNGSPDLITSSISAPSPVRKLWAPALTSHFEFETLVANETTDSVGGFVATINVTTPEGEDPVAAASLVAGEPDLGGNALSFGGNTGTDEAGNFAVMTPGVVDYKDITISAWVVWNGGDAWQRILDCGNDTNNYIFLSPGNGTDGGNCVFALKRNGTEVSISAPALPIGEWTHVVATLSGDTARLYINGEFQSSGTITFNPINIASVNNYLGKSQWPDPYFNGIIDDMVIYNYARSTTQVAKDYMALKGGWICNQEENDMEYDFDNNCKVDILDFAMFASGWMDDFRIYPDQE